MTKDEIKDMLDRYRFENQFYNEKFKELEKIKEYYLKTIKILKEFNQDKNDEFINNIINGYIQDLFDHESKLSMLKTRLNEVESLLDKVSQPYKTVLYYKYIIGESIEEIADKMKYSTQRIYQLHDIGLKQLTKKEEAI